MSVSFEYVARSRIHRFLFLALFVIVGTFHSRELRAQENPRKWKLLDVALLYGQTPGNFYHNQTYHSQLVVLRLPIGLSGGRMLIQPSFILEPRYNRTKLPGSRWTEFDYGLNIGFQLLHSTSIVDVYVVGSTGPHYLSKDFSNGEYGIKQAGGFIFSDNISFGLRRQVRVVDVYAEIRRRHLSNANLKEPNLGIDNVILLVGVGWEL